MSTLTEIEEAIGRLTAEEVAELSRWLQTKGASAPSSPNPPATVGFAQSVVFTHPRDKGPVMTAKEYEALWDEARGSFLDDR